MVACVAILKSPPPGGLSTVNCTRVATATPELSDRTLSLPNAPDQISSDDHVLSIGPDGRPCLQRGRETAARSRGLRPPKKSPRAIAPPKPSVDEHGSRHRGLPVCLARGTLALRVQRKAQAEFLPGFAQSQDADGDRKVSEAMVGLTAIGAGLVAMGIPKDSVLQYKMAIKTAGYIPRGRSRRSRRRIVPGTCTSWVFRQAH
jgi:hypothetical protein